MVVVLPPLSKSIEALADWFNVNEPLVVPPCVIVIVGLFTVGITVELGNAPTSLAVKVISLERALLLTVLV